MNYIIILVLIFAIAFPIGLAIWWKRKTGEGIWCFVAGAICFAVFAYGFEGIMHQLILYGDSAVSSAIQSSPILFMLYASFAAGVFEETGRLFGFKVLLRKHQERETAVAYGIGHGGIEVILILGMTYAIYFLALLGVNLGGAETTQQIISTANSIPAANAFLAMFERVSAMMMHIGLSMIMFTACRAKGKLWLYPVSIFFHALADMPACLYQYQVLTSLIAVEAVAFAMGVASLIIGISIIKKCFNQEEDK